MANQNPRRRPPSSASAAMDPQPIIGVSMSDMQAEVERDGLGPGTLEAGSNLLLYFVYDYLPDSPVSPDAPLSLSAASWGVPDGVDRISRLPDEVLRNVISRLPAKDAARTSTLASRWHGLWRSAPLVLVDAHFLPDGGARGPLVIGAPSPRAVTATVSHVLAAHPGPFRCVHLTCSTMDEHRGEMARWLDVLAAKGVQELTFVNRPWPIDLRLPATLFSCASLTRLYLGVWRLPDTAAVPRAAAFPNLRELGLCLTVMEDRDLAFILERSPVLELLTMMGNQTGVRLRLVSHSLRCVQVSFSLLEDIVVVDAPRLERLFQWSMHGHLGMDSRIKIGHAPKLRVLGYLLPGEHGMDISNTVIMGGTKENVVLSVKIMALEVKFGVRHDVKKVPGFLKCFPNLETLHVHVKLSNKADELTGNGKVNLNFWQEGGPIRCVLQAIKKVFFYEFRGSRSEVAFLKFIAERARVLEKMVIVVAKDCLSSTDDVNAKLKSLTCAKWTSEACKLQVFKSPLSNAGDPVFSHDLASDFSFADPFDLMYYHESL